MKNKTLLISLWTSSILFIIITIGVFLIKFGGNNISNDPAVWGQFGDYFGGVLNPILTVINLIILTYLSIRLVKDEDERNKWTLQELVRPYGEIFFMNSDNSIEIIIENCGLGPLIMTKILITDSNKVVIPSFLEFIKNYETNIDLEYQAYNITQEHGSIGKDKKLTLLKITGDENNMAFVNSLKRLEKKLSDFEVQISYSDMYKRKIDTLKTKIHFHERI